MPQDPILILQMQRMGDLILSFPLMLWLQRLHPGRPVWVAAERLFYEPLLPLSPSVTYFPWEGADVLKKHRYRLVVNLSFRERAARLAGELDADQKLGPVQENGARRVHGDWQLYRSALVRNNRHNRLHWADLNALDCVPLARIRATRFDPPRPPAAEKPQIGLFLGASDAAKRPAPAFWAGLLHELVRRDLRPVLFGGPGEKELGAETRRLFGRPVADFCGRMKLDELARGLNASSLLITPDTGPMHLAAWTGCRTLNLSMGNVSPFETGPYQPGHLVLRAGLPCSEGCWECSREGLDCHDAFTPEAVAFIAGKAVRGKTPVAAPQGLDLYATDRDDRGLFALRRLGSGPNRDDLLGAFWKHFFGWRLGLWSDAPAREALAALAAAFPEECAGLAAALPKAVNVFRAGLAGRGAGSLWESGPTALAPLSGLADLALQNADYAPDAWAGQVARLEALGSLLADC
ncbi:glycosyltransferase family 9 protein [Paucidesulfovibrio longus]|uniref:glycosyltransferase family 9 protein n=1 Tax=Paucidesulfovibrio longus TaxID=889 RepID=UPI0003B4B88E|nr:glycosyltransferase family 9 protein [Paucidesulfovibrio longus]